MNRAGDQFLAGTGLALHAHRRAGIEDFLQLAENLLHGVGFADNTLEADLLLAPFQVDILTTQSLFGQLQARHQVGVVERQGDLRTQKQGNFQVALVEHAGRETIVRLQDPANLVAAPQRNRDHRQDLAAHDRLRTAQLFRGVGGDDGGPVGEYSPQHQPAGTHYVADGSARFVAVLVRVARIGGATRPLSRQGDGVTVEIDIRAQQDGDVSRLGQQFEGRLCGGLQSGSHVESGRQSLQRLVHPQRAGRIVLDPVSDGRQIDDRTRGDQPVAQVVPVAGRRQVQARDHRSLGIAQAQLIAVPEGDLPIRGRIDADQLAGAHHSRAVGRAQIPIDELVAFEKDLPMLARQMVVGQQHGIGFSTPERDDRVTELERLSGCGAFENLDGDRRVEQRGSLAKGTRRNSLRVRKYSGNSYRHGNGRWVYSRPYWIGMPAISRLIAVAPQGDMLESLRFAFERDGTEIELHHGPDGPDKIAEMLAECDGDATVRGHDVIIVNSPSAEEATEMLRKLRAILKKAPVRMPIVYLGNQLTLAEGMAAGANAVLSQPLFVRDVVVATGLVARRRRADLARGDLKDFQGLFYIVRALTQFKRSAVLTVVRGLRRGEIRFFEDQATSAQIGVLHGLSALHHLMLWQVGTFELRFERVVQRKQIPLATDELLTDVRRFLAEVRETAQSLLFVGSYETVDKQVAQVVIPDEIREVLELMDGSRTLPDIVEDSPYRMFETLRIANRLFEHKLIRHVAEISSDFGFKMRRRVEEMVLSPALADSNRRDRRRDRSYSQAEPRSPPRFGSPRFGREQTRNRLVRCHARVAEQGRQTGTGGASGGRGR